jgi:hypothetical protein
VLKFAPDFHKRMEIHQQIDALLLVQYLRVYLRNQYLICVFLDVPMVIMLKMIQEDVLSSVYSTKQTMQIT